MLHEKVKLRKLGNEKETMKQLRVLHGERSTTWRIYPWYFMILIENPWWYRFHLKDTSMCYDISLAIKGAYQKRTLEAYLDSNSVETLAKRINDQWEDDMCTIEKKRIGNVLWDGECIIKISKFTYSG